MRAIVLEGHTLGIIRRAKPSESGLHMVEVLRASVLKGAPSSDVYVLALPTDATLYRPATQQDFDDFRVRSHPDYFLDKPQN